MPRCQYPKCDRVVREPNRFTLCHVHVDLAEFFVWFSEYLQKAERSGGKGTSVRASGLVLPPDAGR